MRYTCYTRLLLPLIELKRGDRIRVACTLVLLLITWFSTQQIYKTSESASQNYITTKHDNYTVLISFTNICNLSSTSRDCICPATSINHEETTQDPSYLKSNSITQREHLETITREASIDTNDTNVYNNRDINLCCSTRA